MANQISTYVCKATSEIKTSAAGVATEPPHPLRHGRTYSGQSFGLSYAQQVLQTGAKPIWTDECRRNGQSIRRWMEDPTQKPWLLLAGAPGTGKTLFMLAMAETIAATPGRARPTFISAADYARMTSKARDEITDGRGVIMLDDIGTEPTSAKDYGTEITPFAEFIARRYDRARELVTINVMTTNLTIDEVREAYGTRTLERLMELSKIVTFTDGSFRRSRPPPRMSTHPATSDHPRSHECAGAKMFFFRG